MRFIRPLGGIVPTIPKPSGHKDKTAMEQGNPSYPVYVTHAMAEAAELVQMMQTGLPQISVPVLLIQSHRDPVIESNASTLISEQLKTHDKETLWLDNSGHVITFGPEREIVFQAAADFIQRVAGQ